MKTDRSLETVFTIVMCTFFIAISVSRYGFYKKMVEVVNKSEIVESEIHVISYSRI